ncbi:MAG TPA: hypothetical protein VLF67_05125 [Candidatus Saccharimonas sp.]|nr:hypothetical protein [Candidatus Saccharimonas sp.]
MELLIQVLCLIAGIVLLLVGFAHHIIILVILGFLLLGCGGVWIIFLGDGDGGDWSWF